MTQILTLAFLEQCLQKQFSDASIRVNSVEPYLLDTSNSILSVLTATGSAKEVGHFGLTVNWLQKEENHTTRMVAKVKPHGDAIARMTLGIAQASDPAVGAAYEPVYRETGFYYCHEKELWHYNRQELSFREALPKIFGTYMNHETQDYLILMEDLKGAHLLNKVNKRDQWGSSEIEAVLAVLARFHAIHYENTSVLPDFFHADQPGKKQAGKTQLLWKDLLRNHSDKLPELYTFGRQSILEQIIVNQPVLWNELEKQPRTLIHYDCNPRNICFRLQENKLQPVLYDWELSTIHVPVYDVVEFLSFVMDVSDHGLRNRYLKIYREAFNAYSSVSINSSALEWQYQLAACHYAYDRLALYTMAHLVNPYPFLPAVLESHFSYLEQVGPEILQRLGVEGIAAN